LFSEISRQLRPALTSLPGGFVGWHLICLDSLERKVNTSNPFQIPSCLQRADVQQRRRERLKKVVVASVAAVVALLIGLLIEGCVSEHSKAPAANSSVLVKPPATSPAARPKPVFSTVLPRPVEPVPAAQAAALQKITPPAISGPEILYVVKPGDTLTRIAKLHGTTVKALKMVNGLNTDNIIVGDRLKLPTA
jgi:LysM repeat protein